MLEYVNLDLAIAQEEYKKRLRPLQQRLYELEHALFEGRYQNDTTGATMPAGQVHERKPLACFPFKKQPRKAKRGYENAHS